MEISEEDWKDKKITRDNFTKLCQRQTAKENISEVIDFYDKWPTYDEHFEGIIVGPGYCADAVKRHLGGRTDISILDVPAGTGTMGVALSKRGFTNIDAVDASAGMLEKAKEKNVYNKIINECFLEKVDYIESDTYDVVVSHGGFCPGHMTNSCLPEIVRITKPGGLVVLAVNIYEGTPSVDPHPLVKAGQWSLLEEHYFPVFFYDDEEGKCYVLKITK